MSDSNKARLAELMTIWASGYLETSVRDVLVTYADQRADPTVVRFVSRTLDRFRNPRMDKIIDTVGSFDSDLAGELQDYVEGSIEESVNSIVGLRNRVAHGKSVSVSIARIAQYFEDAKKLSRKLQQVLA